MTQARENRSTQALISASLRTCTHHFYCIVSSTVIHRPAQIQGKGKWALRLDGKSCCVTLQRIEELGPLWQLLKDRASDWLLARFRDWFPSAHMLSSLGLGCVCLWREGEGHLGLGCSFQ